MQNEVAKNLYTIYTNISTKNEPVLSTEERYYLKPILQTKQKLSSFTSRQEIKKLKECSKFA